MIAVKTGAGAPEPLGATWDGNGVNIAVVSRHGTAVDVCFFDENDAEVGRFRLTGRTGSVFHGRIEGISPGARYGLRVDGPWDPAEGHRFNSQKLLVDPRATRLDRPFRMHGSLYDARIHGALVDDADSAAFVPKAIVEAAQPLPASVRPTISAGERIVYECHVRGFTKLHPDIPEEIRGTFAGLAHPAAIGHLVRLGVNVLELMPIWAGIDERHLGPLGLSNYWNYNPVTPFAVDPRLAPGGWAEVRAAVDALHAAGIQVILDVVLNHTGESDHLGPTIAFRGFDNALWYRLRADDPSRYVDDSGCGNGLALDRADVARLGLDALRHAAEVGGFDGFRYDLATALGRRAKGFDPDAPILTALRSDPSLRDLIHVAEPWDIGPGGYRLGAFPAGWPEWNDRWRDTMRRFWRGDQGIVGEVATRFAGSTDVFAGRHRATSDSLNFITAHDGFTLADLVAYAHKHNEANGEANRDGTDANNSWNHGVEGPSDDVHVRAARARDVRALLATLMTSRGAPMLSMGDEAGRTQRGNNNAYAQDNEISWFDWAGADQDLIDFTARLARLRKAHPAFADGRPPTGGAIGDSGVVDLEWRRFDGAPFGHGDWHDPENYRLVAVMAVETATGVDRVMVALSVDPRPAVFTPPSARPGMAWRLELDSAHPDREGFASAKFAVDGRSVTIYVEEPAPDDHRARPVDPLALDGLARAAGIAPDWWDLSGGNHAVGDDAKRAILAAMGLPAATLGEARDSLERLAEETARRPLPMAATLFEGGLREISIGGATALGGGRLRVVVELEDGDVRAVTVEPGEGRVETITGADGRVYERRFVRLPELPIGRHRLRIEGIGATTALTVAPATCHLPIGGEGRRLWGLSAHLYALRHAADQGIGDFTTLSMLAEKAGAAGAATIGLNPLHALFPGDRERASPYSPSDRRFLDPMFIDVTRLPAPLAGGVGMELPRAVSEALRLQGLSHVDYTAVWAAKSGVLRAAFAAFEDLAAAGRNPLLGEFDAFVARGGEALARFATFEAIAAVTGATTASGFPADLAHADAPGVVGFAARHARAVRLSLFQQWLADRQLGEAAATARDAGLALGYYRDLAVGCAPDGAEAWGAGARLMHRVSVGAPPDPFAVDGQVWSLPPLNPVESARLGHAPFAELIRANMAHAGALRIDHVLGLRRLFVVPDGARGSEGAYVDQPFEDLIGQLTLESRRAGCVVVGEDLGTVPWGFRERMAEAKVLSYQVVWFEREGEGFRSPKHYPALGTAVVGSHDLATLAGWWTGEDLAEDLRLGRTSVAVNETARAARAREKRILVDTLIASGQLPRDVYGGELPEALDDAVVAAIHGWAAEGRSMLALVQTDDLSGEVERLNLPGTDRERPNWRRRLSVGVEELLTTPRAAATLAALADRGARR
ncbi:MAG: glycogen debranching protein GlgX [Hyphomicrobiales bacterium]|nr:glycogen debranching protein GlgX [Hyphomicrobiales bacterium]